MKNNLRAFGRATLGLAAMPFLLGALVLQGFVIGPVFKNYTAIPNFFYNSLKDLFGYKITFNKASAPMDNDKPTWFVANHQSIADFIVLGSTLKGTFAGRGDIMRWPGIAQMARAVKYIGIRRVKKEDPNFKKYNAMTIGKIMKNFNSGNNTIMFPEGTTTDGTYLAMFRAGLISMLFGEKGMDKNGNEVKLDKEVVVQPVAIKIKSIDGKSLDEKPELIESYSMFHEDNTLKRIWRRLAIGKTEIELTVFPPLNPKDFKDQFELINAAHENVRSVVAPNQTETKKAAIPGVDDHRADTVAPPRPVAEKTGKPGY